MKRNNIIILLYNGYVYLKCNKLYDSLPLDKNIISNGRLNNIDKLIKLLKKSTIIKNSIYKLVSDNLTLIYFANYNDLEKSYIKSCFNERGYNSIIFLDIKDILDLRYNYIISNNGFIYYINSGKKYIIDDDIFSNFKFSNSEIIIDLKLYKKHSSKLNNLHIYAVDNVVEYILNCIC